MRIIRIQLPGGDVLHAEDLGDGTALLLSGSIATGFTRTHRRELIHKRLAPIQPTDIICIGRNYRAPNSASCDASAATASNEVGRPLGPGSGPHSPHVQRLHDDATLEVFLKPSTAIQNPDDPVLVPQFAGIDLQLDCEGELAIIMARQARNVSEREALDHVFGYTIATDVTARFFQTPTGPPMWMRGKGFDTFCPLGPAIVTRDELKSPDSLTIRTRINGTVVRDGSTRCMIRSVPEIIATLSRHITLPAAGVILTGAPPAIPGVDAGLLQQVNVDIEQIGCLSNPVRQVSER